MTVLLRQFSERISQEKKERKKKIFGQKKIRMGPPLTRQKSVEGKVGIESAPFLIKESRWGKNKQENNTQKHKQIIKESRWEKTAKT